MVYLILIFAGLFVFLSYRRLDWALMLILVCLPVYQLRFSAFGLPMTLLEVMILSSFAVWFLRETKFLSFLKRQYGWRDYLVARKERAPYPFRHEIALVLVVSFVAVGISHFSNSSLGIWKAYFFEPILFYVLVLNVFQEKDETGKAKFNFEKIILPILFSGFLVSLFAIFQKATGILTMSNFWPRVTGVFTYPNALGLYLAPMVLLATGMIKNYELRITNFKFLGFLGLILVYLLAIVFASSEGALVGILAAWFIFALLWVGEKFKFNFLNYLAKIFIIIFLGFSIIAPWFFLKVIPEYKYFNFSSHSLNYLTDKLMLKDFSGEVRKQQWRETWAMMTVSPATFIFGTGLDNYRASVAPYHQPGIFFNFDRDMDFRRKIVWAGSEYKTKHWQPVEIYMYPHNIFLNFWTELGLAGMVLFIWIIGRFIYIGLKLLKQESEYKGIILGLIGAMIVIFVHGLVDVPYFKNDLAVVFWVLLALMGALEVGLKKKVR